MEVLRESASLAPVDISQNRRFLAYLLQFWVALAVLRKVVEIEINMEGVAVI